MKTVFTETWQTDDIPDFSNDFRNEVKDDKEVKEENEDKDGWVWVCGVDLSDCIVTCPKTSNRLLHTLARKVRGFERTRGRMLSLLQYYTIFERWELASKSYLRATDYLTEFLAKLDSVKVPEGATLAAAFLKTKSHSAPAKLEKHPSSSVQHFGSLCRELSVMSNGQPIMLSQSAIAKLFECEPRTICNWIKALKTIRLLSVAKPAIPKKTAATYYYLD